MMPKPSRGCDVCQPAERVGRGQPGAFVDQDRVDGADVAGLGVDARVADRVVDAAGPWRTRSGRNSATRGPAGRPSRRRRSPSLPGTGCASDRCRPSPRRSGACRSRSPRSPPTFTPAPVELPDPRHVVGARRGPGTAVGVDHRDHRNARVRLLGRDERGPGRIRRQACTAARSIRCAPSARARWPPSRRARSRWSRSFARAALARRARCARAAATRARRSIRCPLDLRLAPPDALELGRIVDQPRVSSAATTAPRACRRRNRDDPQRQQQTLRNASEPRA